MTDKCKAALDAVECVRGVLLGAYAFLDVTTEQEARAHAALITIHATLTELDQPDEETTMYASECKTVEQAIKELKTTTIFTLPWYKHRLGLVIDAVAYERELDQPDPDQDADSVSAYIKELEQPQHSVLRNCLEPVSQQLTPLDAMSAAFDKMNGQLSELVIATALKPDPINEDVQGAIEQIKSLFHSFYAPGIAILSLIEHHIAKLTKERDRLRHAVSVMGSDIEPDEMELCPPHNRCLSKCGECWLTWAREE